MTFNMSHERRLLLGGAAVVARGEPARTRDVCWRKPDRTRYQAGYNRVDRRNPLSLTLRSWPAYLGEV